ncbi:PRC-barrel domain-containing protein [Hyphomicrobium sp. CS1GBMeth3]|uniref:PRC-barrel domain-containing protein n=1 Tax=Hyphomicrobium sp. CS1GBMeth3 TaxID=1892845 RepID=UPI0009F9ABCA|nr:PRC-barrel domain-containing protein [Hyphomicrobium sp. CS1GBMeth3]
MHNGALRLLTIGTLASLPLCAAVGQVKTPSAPQTPQSAPSQASPDVAPPSSEVLTGDWRASKLIGTTMSNVLGESVGRVEDVVIGSDGKVVAVMVGIGGFLGLGETSVAIGLRHLVITPLDSDQLEVRTSLSRRAIEQAAQVGPIDDGPLPE